MHSGFAALRTHWPMKAVGNASVTLPGEGLMDVARVQQLWHDCRSQYAQRGPWLFGEYSIADAMYAPVALRFRHYVAPIASPLAQAYQEQLIQDPYMQEWLAEAAAGSGHGLRHYLAESVNNAHRRSPFATAGAAVIAAWHLTKECLESSARLAFKQDSYALGIRRRHR